MRSGSAVVGRVARLVLLVCTLLGLAAMHTIGHNAVGHGADRHGADRHGAVVHLPMDPADVVVALTRATGGALDLLTASYGCLGDGCVHPALMPSGAGGTGAGELCVAVLTAFAVAVLLAALLSAAANRRSQRVAGRGRAVAPPRGPPVRSFGLTLATVSVLLR